MGTTAREQVGVHAIQIAAALDCPQVGICVVDVNMVDIDDTWALGLH